LGDCFFFAGSFVPLEGIVYHVDSIDGSDNANGQSPKKRGCEGAKKLKM